jgi:hypothetical protein
VKKWHNDTTGKSRATDLDEAVTRLSQYVEERGNEMVDVDVYGRATDFGRREQEAQEKEEAQRRTSKTQVRTVAQDSAFTIAYVALAELDPKEELSVSAPTLSGAAQAASHSNVMYLTNTFVRMGYLQDFQKGVYLLLDPKYLWGDAIGLQSTLKARLTPRKQCWFYVGKAKWNS